MSNEKLEINQHLSNDAEEIQTRHRKEKKELQSKITSMKHSVPKTDKKAKKEMAATIAKLESELDERHEAELRQLQSVEHINKSNNSEIASNHELPSTALSNGDVYESEKAAQRVTRAQKRRDKKENQSKNRQRLIDESSAEVKSGHRETEKRLFKPILAERSLKLVEIAADGDCMYNSVAHQMQLKGGPADQCECQMLREMAAETIRKHRDEFAPFLLDHDSGELLNDQQFDDYCRKITKATVWGGQPELKALSLACRRRIDVLQANGAPIVVGEEFVDKEPLIITYHRHAYRLGEHYNSTAPTNAELDGSDDSD